MTREHKYSRGGSEPPKLEIKGVLPVLGGAPLALRSIKSPNFKAQEARGSRTLPKDGQDTANA